MIRPATLADVNAILTIATQEASRYERLKFSADKVRKLIIKAVSSAKHFCWVSENDEGQVTGTLVGLVNENLWAQRQACHAVLWKAEVPGDGLKMLRELKNWITARRAIRVAGFVNDLDDVDARVWNLVEMSGFERQGGAYLLYN